MRRGSRPEREDGMVTAETAVVLPVLLFVLAGAVAAVVVVAGQLRCVDAAREGARAASRGEPAVVVQRIAGAAAPDGAVVGVGSSGDAVTVTVTAVVAPLGPVPWRVTVTATATAVVEPAARGSAP
ncbi:TadE family type IV pilus minor pilin [Modestobacter sp. SYSU DS0290]